MAKLVHANLYVPEIQSASAVRNDRREGGAQAPRVGRDIQSNPALIYVIPDDLEVQGLGSRANTRAQSLPPAPRRSSAGDSNNDTSCGSTCNINITNDGIATRRTKELKEKVRKNKRDKVMEKALWKLLGAEFLGAAILLFFGVGCSIKYVNEDKPHDFTGEALCWGTTVATICQALGDVSCVINPAITMSHVLTGKIELVKALMYIPCQFLGALSGVAILKAIVPDKIEGVFGVTSLGFGITPIQGCLLEFMSTFVIVLTSFAVNDEYRTDIQGSKPLAVGFAVTAIVMCSGHMTGASLNPFRSMAPSILMNHYPDFWVYWVGPIIGALCGGLTYEHIFRHLRPEEIEAFEAERLLKKRAREQEEDM